MAETSVTQTDIANLARKLDELGCQVQRLWLRCAGCDPQKLDPTQKPSWNPHSSSYAGVVPDRSAEVGR